MPMELSFSKNVTQFMTSNVYSQKLLPHTWYNN